GHVVEDAVEDDPDPELLRLLGELLELLQVAERGIDPLVVGRVVAVVRLRPEDRVEVDRSYPERLQVLELLAHTLQVAAEVVPAARALRTAGCVVAAVPLRERVPRLRGDGLVVAEVTRLRVVLRVPVPEAVGKDLVDEGAF